MHPYVKWIQICSNGGPTIFQRGIITIILIIRGFLIKQFCQVSDVVYGPLVFLIIRYFELCAIIVGPYLYYKYINHLPIT